MSIGFILPSVFPKWFTPAGDAVLAGGTLEFFAVGTTTPKSVYADYQQLSMIGNVVTLDGAGDATIFLGSGGYKVILKDSLGAQLDLVDGIFGTGGSAAVDSNATYGFFKVYNDLRAISTAIDVAYVAGRDEEGDGGEGWFQLQPGVVAHDDDGIFLAAVGGSIEYKRIFDSAISPEWYGVRYAVSVDQSVALLQALNASAAVNFPVLVTDRIFLAQNVAAPVGASLVTGQDAYFQANASVSLTFQAGTRFDGRGVAFSGTVQPIFAAGTVDAIRLSWMGGTGAEKWARLLASTVATIPVLMDESTSLTSGLTIPANLALEPVGGAVVTFNGAAWLEVGTLNFRSAVQWAAFAADSYVGNISIGADVCYMEWFGGSASNTGNQNAIPFRACLFTERVDLLPGKTYTVTSTNPIAFSNSNTARLNGNGSTLVLNQDITITVVETNDITISGTGALTVSSGIFNRSIIFKKLLGGAKSARNSQLFDVNKIVESNDSTIYGGLVEIGGKLDNCVITLPGTVQVNAGYTITGCTFGKSESQHLPAFSFPTDPTHAIFSGCSFDIDGLLCYSENTSLVVDLVGCASTDSFSKALSNGYAKINLKGCGVVNNSNVYSIDGVDLEVANTTKIGDSHVAQVITNSTTNWKGLGSPTSDGTTLTLGANAALSSDPYSPNTIRCVALGVFDAAWRYGGIFETEVTYPAGSAPDLDTELVVMFCHPPTANVATVGVNAIGDGNYYNTMPVDLGRNLPVRLPIVNGAKLKTRTNVWGGQIDLRAVPEDHSTYTVSDIWGDAATSVPTNTASTIQEFGRLVIYNTGTGILPAGTKIKVMYRYDLPNRDQFKKFFSNPSPWQHASSDFYRFAPTGWQAVRVRTSLTASYSGQTQLAIPLMFRDCDKNGVQAVVSRRESDSMQVVAWNGATLANGWS